MVNRSRIALSRIACPHWGIEEFFAVTAELGLGKVELRNDLPGGRVIDDLAPARVAELAAKHRIEILSINALQKFNLPAALEKATRELEALIELSRSIGCRAIVHRAEEGVPGGGVGAAGARDRRRDPVPFRVHRNLRAGTQAVLRQLTSLTDANLRHLA